MLTTTAAAFCASSASAFPSAAALNTSVFSRSTLALMPSDACTIPAACSAVVPTGEASRMDWMSVVSGLTTRASRRGRHDDEVRQAGSVFVPPDHDERAGAGREERKRPVLRSRRPGLARIPRAIAVGVHEHLCSGDQAVGGHAAGKFEHRRPGGNGVPDGGHRPEHQPVDVASQCPCRVTPRRRFPSPSGHRQAG